MPEAGSQLYSVQEENLGKPETKPDALRAHKAIDPDGHDRLALATTTTAHSTEPTDQLQDNLMDNQNFIFLVGFTLMLAMLANLFWHICARVTKKSPQPPSTDETKPQQEETTGTKDMQNDQGTQTEHVKPETLISLRRREKELEAQNTHLQAQLKQAEQRLIDQQVYFQKDFQRQREHYELQ